MHVDTFDAVETFEAIGEAVRDAGRREFCGFQFVAAMRAKGYRLVLERIPADKVTAPVERFDAAA